MLLLTALIYYLVFVGLIYLLGFVIHGIVALYFILVKKIAFKTFSLLFKLLFTFMGAIFIPLVFLGAMLSLKLYLFVVLDALIIAGIFILTIKKVSKKKGG